MDCCFGSTKFLWILVYGTDKTIFQWGSVELCGIYFCDYLQVTGGRGDIPPPFLKVQISDNQQGKEE